MFLVLLKFSINKAHAGDFMQAHNAWLKRGFDEGVFLLVGSLKPSMGGAIVAHATTLAALKDRVDSDPFVAQNVVSAEILEVATSRADPRLDFLEREVDA